ncbi:hypothetical protein ASPWEDRAFT_27934 [Aspergillus wentii DTO 134E9]|uniref:Prolyl 4-hydroxylase alpha subunit domain-containing protein n=1 Tax=Aspergillus wentii DTO 134E9 TaxID=1073089 RepID=A0A1L9RK12_ASPWE|nr:uncharacterized protein ASPWEDRAFT_27934 [Aspergillus wentii DTO 134E9]KAI9923584.1 hypothetical protein MW887_008506 [Aspergillus wentii]OJJ35279.1 hypothetical protein ASPWEDRAFT_27934 [Aspergillus wentii DTO 134E9]
MSLPASFLPPILPSNATVRRIDFTTTTPPIPEYRNHFALVIDNFLTESECKALLQAAEASTQPDPAANTPDNNDTPPTWERALVNAGGGRQTVSIDRNCGRISYNSPIIAQKLFMRLHPILMDAGIDTVFNQGLITGLGPWKRQEVFRVSRLNERLSFLRYEGGEFFKPHWDALRETENEKEISLFTTHLYLNGEGEQDLEELEKAREEAESMPESTTTERRGNPSATLLGGATSFQNGFSNKEVVRIFPKTGSLLIFQQKGLLHAGDDVYRGVKYTMRTDVLYRKSLRV